MPGNDTYTKLLIHSNAVQGNADFTDSATGKTISVAGNTHHEQNQINFGKTSIYFDGVGDDLNLADHADWNFAAGNFTIDAWIRFSGLGTVQHLIAQHQTAAERWALLWDSTNGISFVVRTGGVNVVLCQQGATTGWSAFTWYHVAIVRNVNAWNIYRAGTNVASATDADSVPDFVGALLYIGQDGAAANYFTGYMDEIRISKGIARWTGAFTPSTGIYNKLAKLNGYDGSGKILGSKVIAKVDGHL